MDIYTLYLQAYVKKEADAPAWLSGTWNLAKGAGKGAWNWGVKPLFSKAGLAFSSAIGTLEGIWDGYSAPREIFDNAKTPADALNAYNKYYADREKAERISPQKDGWGTATLRTLGLIGYPFKAVARLGVDMQMNSVRDEMHLKPIQRFLSNPNHPADAKQFALEKRNYILSGKPVTQAELDRYTELMNSQSARDRYYNRGNNTAIPTSAAPTTNTKTPSQNSSQIPNTTVPNTNPTRGVAPATNPMSKPNPAPPPTNPTRGVAPAANPMPKPNPAYQRRLQHIKDINNSNTQLLKDTNAFNKNLGSFIPAQ